MWKQWINALAGLGTVIASFLGLTGDTVVWTFGILGVVVLVLSLWTVGEVSNKDYEEVVRRHRHA